MRRFILVGIILAVLLIGVVAYFFFFDSQNRLLGNSSSSSPSNGVNQAIEISSRKVLAPVLSLDQTSLWYFDQTGLLFKNTLDGKNEENFSLQGAVPLETVFWPPAGNDFLVLTKATEGEGKFMLYQALLQSFSDLPTNIVKVAWLPDGKSIAYIWQRGDGKMELKVGDETAKNYRKVADVDLGYTLTASPSGEFALLQQTTGPTVPNKVIKVDLTSGKSDVVLDRGKNTGVLISPDGKKMLFTRINSTSNLPEVWLYDFANSSFDNLGIITSLDKAAWSRDSSKFYFGLPKSVVITDVEVKLPTADDLYVYTLATKNRQKVELGGKAFDIRSLVIADNESMLFFRHGSDGKLYRVNLK